MGWPTAPPDSTADNPSSTNRCAQRCCESDEGRLKLYTLELSKQQLAISHVPRTRSKSFSPVIEAATTDRMVCGVISAFRLLIFVNVGVAFFSETLPLTRTRRR